jgi:hypothetical protein
MRIKDNILRRKAKLVGAAVTVAATGSTVADAALLTGVHNLVTAANATKGVILPANRPAGEILTVVNTAAATLKVYPPTGGDINNGSDNAAVLLRDTQTGLFVSLGSNNWSTDVSASANSTVAGSLAVGGTANITGSLVVTNDLGVGAMAVPHSISVAVAAGASNTMTITVTIKQASGAALAQVNTLLLYMSEVNSGMGITADGYSGDLTATAGAILGSVVAKKAWLVATAPDGIFVGSLVDTAKPADQYAVAVHPLNGRPVVSAVSGTNWGA